MNIQPTSARELYKPASSQLHIDTEEKRSYFVTHKRHADFLEVFLF